MNRIVLAPLFFAAYFLPALFDGTDLLSVCILIPLFIYMQLTDFLDGFFARKYGIASDFGKLFDPFTDVLANITVFFAFVLSGYMPPFLFLIIIYREMGIQFVRTLCIRNGVVIGARMAGKAKTVVYIAAGAFSLFIESLLRLNNALGFAEKDTFLGLAESLKAAGTVAYALAAFLSVFSFAIYIKTFAAAMRQGNPKKAGSQ